jgi:hypothetical protein
MNRRAPLLNRATGYALGFAALAACNDPFPPNTTPPPEVEDCGASLEWLLDSGGTYTQTPPVDMFKPLPHPTTECPFYRGGWQNFLLATQPVDAKGTPAFVTEAYKTIDDVFTPRVAHGPNRSFLGDIKQAGLRETLIDRNGNTLYYGIQVNQAFSDFIHVNQLETSAAIQAYSKDAVKKNLFFPAGLVEMKSAWQLVEGTPDQIADQTKNYISMVTSVPTMHMVTDPSTGEKTLTENRDEPRAGVTVRLLALHVVFTLPGHPEFIWASFEHTLGPPDAGAADHKRDLAPTFEGANPTDADMTNHNISVPVTLDNFYSLYNPGTPVNRSNSSITEAMLNLDETKQKFVDPVTGDPQQTPIYRMFPASKSNTTVPDGAVTSLNHNVEAVFKMAVDANQLPANDKRQNYRLLGGQWMDRPEFYRSDFPIQNDPSNPYAQDQTLANGDTNPNYVPGLSVGLTKFNADIKDAGSDSPYSILAGEDRMSSVAMESFTQPPGNFNNCFTCHNTQAINAKGVPFARQGGVKLLDPGLLNVSHIISQFVLEDCGNSVVTDPDGTQRADCTAPPQ